MQTTFQQISKLLFKKKTSHIVKEESYTNEEKFKISSSLIDEIIESVVYVYIADKKKLISGKKPITFESIVNKNEGKIYKKLDYIQKSSGKHFKLCHLETHKQFIDNLCGYETSFFLIETLNLLKNSSLDNFYSIKNSAKFWKFHFQCVKFLIKYAKKYEWDNEDEKNKWPWNLRTIMFGDFERTFSKVYFQNYPTFVNALKTSSKFRIKNFFFYLQFGNILNSDEELDLIEKELYLFRTEKKNQHFISFMLGITNHWLLLLFHRIEENIEIWCLDSRNLDYLTWTAEEIQSHYLKKNEERKKIGRIPLNEFKLMVIQQSVKDIQLTLNLIVDCALGNTSFINFKLNAHVIVIYNDFQSDNFELLNKFKEKKHKSFIENNDENECLRKLDSWLQRYKSSLYRILIETNEKISSLGKNELGKILEIFCIYWDVYESSSYLKNINKFYRINKFKFLFDSAFTIVQNLKIKIK